jgi:hypothetical protein
MGDAMRRRGLSPISLIHITHYLSHGSGPEAQYLVPY